MAGKTTNTKKKGSTSSGRKNTGKKYTVSKKQNKQPIERKRSKTFATHYAPYIIGVLAAFVAICIYAGGTAGVVGNGIKKLLLGLNGAAAYGLPALIIVHLIRYKRDKERRTVGWCYFATASIYVLSSVLFQVFGASHHQVSTKLWDEGIALRGGGIVGGSLGEVMLKCFGTVLTVLISVAILLVCVLFLFNITPRWVFLKLKASIRRSRERAAEERAERREAYDYEDEDDDYYDGRDKGDSYAPADYEQVKITEGRGSSRKRRRFCPDVPIDDVTVDTDATAEDVISDEEKDRKKFDEVMRRTQERIARENGGSAAEAPEDTADGEDREEVLSSVYGDGERATIDLSKIFTDPEERGIIADAGDEASTESALDGFTVERGDLLREASSSKTEPAPTVESTDGVVRGTVEKTREYVFPPITLLTEDNENRDDNIMDEIKSNAVKLVDILSSFNVRVKIDNVSRGPTITRYELLPEAGVRVKSIINLLDDISLALATTGVRIEAPIPGKAAVGIEVPNKKRTTVHLRTLLEADEFLFAKSKTLCALGEDVGGAPIYLDVAKMPHLLVAGATGMGKSVCINSLIVSLLYNAKPDEVKLILIDPKKVEFGIYNGIPHLLVPVVTEPKKAAGSLSWAVSEMERRFGLIEEVGVRDVTTFNKVTKDDPQYEFLPNIIIIIDELADLMMTAPDDVEDSICRLMQKARAAGMYVIIGTQRPSVDVITGLIKANIPSRIACKVASQVDSRTIIDRAGAENLIGRGDMLYSPVGAPKPMRVQGSFVSEEDVEKVVSFIKTENKEGVEYSEEVIAKIDEEASRCGVGGKKQGAVGASGDGDDGGDPMLRSALELAVNSGKISTSLIERRLSLGYGRAAKLIDKMEQMGYVSAPNGQKPREVLITKEQYQEMMMKKDDGEE